MSKRKELERLVGELESGGISRRDFVRRAMAMGLSVSSVGAEVSRLIFTRPTPSGVVCVVAFT